MSRWLRTILPICVVVLVAEGAFSCWSIYQFVDTVQEQNRTLALKAHVDRLHRLIHHLESSERSFLITNNPFYLEAFEDSVPRASDELAQLKLIADAAPESGAAFSRLADSMGRKIAELRDTVSLARNKHLAEAIRRANADDSVRLTGEVLDALADFDNKAEAELRLLRAFVDKYSASAVAIIVTTTIIALVLVLSFAWLMYREIQGRIRIAHDLEKARHAALVASKLKSQFLATVSHEVRTPLNGIIGMSDILRGKLKGSEHRGLVDIIHQSGSTLLKIVNDILDFSKIEAGKIDFEIADFSPVMVVESVAELLSLKAREKGVALLTYVDPELSATLNGDPSRITQVLQNLVGNALKFTESGAVLIHARLQRAETGPFIRFEVRDTGVGIPEDKISLLFQPFNQLQQPEGQREEGTGLGLSISKNLVERMDGAIGVSSEAGIGSTFWFTLPLRPVGRDTVGSRSRLTGPPMGALAMLVGAGEFLRVAVSGYFREMGIPLEPRATSPLEVERALAALGPRRKLIVVLDLRWMGEAKARQVLAETKDERVSFIAVARGQFEDAERSLFGPRVKGFLRAPFSREQFYAAVGAILAPTAALIVPASAPAEPPRKPAKTRSRRPADGEKLVLVAEDNSVNQTIARIYLEQLGHRVHCVANGEEALEALTRISYDLVLMDVQMPVMDGYEATRRIRRLEAASGKHVPVVAMTANAIQGDREKCLAAGMDDYISKPFQESDLRDAIARANAAGQGAVDWSVLADLAMKTNKTVVTKLVDSFRGTLPNTLTEIRAAREPLDRDKLRFWAHQLKSSSATLGAKRLSEACARLELAAAGENREGDAVAEGKAERADLGALADQLLALGELALKEYRELADARIEAMPAPPPRAKRLAPDQPGPEASAR